MTHQHELEEALPHSAASGCFGSGTIYHYYHNISPTFSNIRDVWPCSKEATSITYLWRTSFFTVLMKMCIAIWPSPPTNKDEIDRAAYLADLSTTSLHHWLCQIARTSWPCWLANGPLSANPNCKYVIIIIISYNLVRSILDRSWQYNNIVPVYSNPL